MFGEGSPSTGQEGLSHLPKAGALLGLAVESLHACSARARLGASQQQRGLRFLGWAFHGDGRDTTEQL